MQCQQTTRITGSNCFVIVCHAGAGSHAEGSEGSYKAVLVQACRAAHRVLQSGGSSLDAVVASVTVLEDDPVCNAGMGSNLTLDGCVECDASVMEAAAGKARAAGCAEIIACERGTQFGYGDLIFDPRNLVWMRSAGGLVTADITHSLQQPGGRVGADGERSAGGLRELIPTIARTAVAVGVDGLFMEVHDEPERSLCDAPTQWPLDRLAPLLGELAAIAEASRWRDDEKPFSST